MEKLFKIEHSGIAGNGVFATQKIAKGQTIHFMVGEICSTQEIIDRIHANAEAMSDPFPIDDEYFIDLEETSRSFNHSCEPNTYIKGKNTVVAIRDIEIGEELTFDYSTTMHNEEAMISNGFEPWTCPCHCGASTCRGIIDQFKTLPKATQDFYISNKYMPSFMLAHFEAKA